jgi:hypothetical protein
MQEIGNIESVVATLISNCYLSQNCCCNSVQLCRTQVRWRPVPNELMLYTVHMSSSISFAVSTP